MLAKTPVTQRSPCYSAVSALLKNPLPDHSNYSPFCHPHYLTPDQYFTSLFRPDPLPSHELETNTSKFNAAALYCRIYSGTQCLQEAEQQVDASVDVPYPPLQIVNSVLFSLYLYPLSAPFLKPLSAPFLNPLSSPSPPSLLSLLINFCLPKIKTSNFITLCSPMAYFFCILFHTMTIFK